MFLPSIERTRLQSALIERLAALSLGETISTADIEAVTSLKINDSRAVLYAAMRELNQTHGAIFENIRGVGYRRISQENAAEVGSAARRSIGRKARLTARQLSNFSAKTNGLAPEVAEKINREISIAGLIEFAASNLSLKAVGTMQAEDKPPSLAEAGKALLARLGA